MQDISSVVSALLPSAPFDAVSVGIVDFGKKKFETLEAVKCQGEIRLEERLPNYFDLASLTKPLTNSLSYFLSPELFDEEMRLCLNHRGSLPAWGLLPVPGWREQILAYRVSPGPTLYSDFSALRVMLEFNRRSDMRKLCQNVWSAETVHWLDLPGPAATFQCGYKNGEPNFGQVHDPNAWVIKDFCSHAGLFSTLSGLCQTLLNFEAETTFLEKVSQELSSHAHRFAGGWDRVENPQTALAGKGCGALTFGHLGFTGTSIWIDPERRLGHVILTNAVKRYWYEKQDLNDLRRAIGEMVWARS